MKMVATIQNPLSIQDEPTQMLVVAPSFSSNLQFTIYKASKF